MKRGENLVNDNGRVTLARATTNCAPKELPPLKESSEGTQKKRAAADKITGGSTDNVCQQRKRRAVFQDVTNICCKPSYGKCFNAAKVQAKSGKPTTTTTSLVKGSKTQNAEERVKTESEPQEFEHSSSLINVEIPPRLDFVKGCTIDDNPFGNHSHSQSLHKNATKVRGGFYGILSSNPEIIDIDSDCDDPQQCSLYAPDIYQNLRVAELARRPHPNLLGTIQRDITQSMRGILVDWLVEVTEEYKLMPDTLYLTIFLIDWFLYQNYIEREKLQLLGITCMLIASKFEETRSPRIEEFCFITANTYTKDEVLQMESQVLKCLGFQLFSPTTITFLRCEHHIFFRRFIRVAQASNKTTPSVELEFLASYLAELTLIDYEFLRFVPSIIAASAVFLSKWTLDQSSHPWNPTLEHYTSYKSSDLKVTVFALQDLQLNTLGCPLSAIRSKYRQEKFKTVAALSSPKLLETLF